jgi:hypothetical protein
LPIGPRFAREARSAGAEALAQHPPYIRLETITRKRRTDGAESIRAYGRRFTIEETFRDTKDITFGAGLRATHIRNAARRDRMLLLIAVAHTALTVLGAASEVSGLDRTLKANTVKHRTMSLLNQGLHWYRTLGHGIRPEWGVRLLEAYDRLLREPASSARSCCSTPSTSCRNEGMAQGRFLIVPRLRTGDFRKNWVPS